MGANAIKDVIRNDSLTIVATVTDPNNGGAPIKLDGYTAYLTVKATLDKTSNVNDDPGLMQIEIIPVNDPTGTGIVSFTCAPSNTNILPGKYFYDVEVISPGGNIYSSIADNFNVIADSTRATS